MISVTETRCGAIWRTDGAWGDECPASVRTPLPGAVLRIRASKQRKYATGGGGVFPFLHAEAGEAQPYYT